MRVTGRTVLQALPLIVLGAIVWWAYQRYWALEDVRPETQLKVDVEQSGDPAGSSTAAPDERDLRELIRRLHLAEVMSRPDLLNEALSKLKAIAPAHRQALFFEAYQALLSGNNQRARDILEKYESAYPNSTGARQLSDLIDAETTRKRELQQARLLATAGRHAKALESYDSLFPDGRPTLTLELEYLRTQASLESRWQETFQALKRLDAEYPDVPPIELALADHLMRNNSDSRRALNTYKRLAYGYGFGRQAADSWLRVLNSQAINRDVLAEYRELASRYPGDIDIQERYKAAQAEFKAEQQRLQNPHYRARKEGLVLLNRDKTKKAKGKLLQALKGFPRDEEVLGGLGIVYLREGRQAKALDYFARARNNNLDPDLTSKWDALYNTSLYWANLDRADLMIEQRQYREAEELLRENIKVNPAAPEAYQRLAEIEKIRGNYAEADRRYIQALSVEPLHEPSLWGRVELLAERDNRGAAMELAFSYSKGQRAQIADRLRAWQLENALVSIQHAIARGDRDTALDQIQSALDLKPGSAWQRADIAYALVSLGKTQRADSLMADWAQSDSSPDMQFAYALYLESRDRLDEAVATLEGIPLSQRSDSMQANLRRLAFDQQLARVSDGSNEMLVATLNQMEIDYRQDPDNQMRVARQWLAIDRPDRAEHIVDGLKPTDAWPLDRQLAYGELLLALDKLEAFGAWYAGMSSKEMSAEQKTRFDRLNARFVVRRARDFENRGDYDVAYAFYQQSAALAGGHQLAAQLGVVRMASRLGYEAVYADYRRQLLKNPERRTPSEVVLIADTLHQLGDHERAELLLSDVEQRGDASAFELRNAMLLAEEIKAWKTSEVLALKAIEKETGLNPAGDPKMLYAAADSNWLTRSARSTVDRVRAREDGHIWFGLDFSEREDTEEAFLVPIEILYPISKWDGHLLARIDYVSLDSGDVDYIDRPTLSPLTTQRIEFREKQTGIALGLGWRAEDWWMDLGTTPQGFSERTWVGGVGLAGDVGDVGWKLNLSRRPEVGTTLSYAGMEVPAEASGFQGSNWGGVVRTGAKLGLSYDLGGEVGYWASLQAHQLTGERVEDNNRFGVLGGVYWRARESVPHNIRVGVNLLHLRYDKNLELRGLDNGGYFSPQNYLSLSLPVRYFGRRGHDFSYMVGASVSHSWSKEDAPFGYGEGSSSGGGFGFTLEAAVEKRISDHWYVGAAADIQRADFYEPNHFTLYARYTFKDRWNPVPTPPEPPIPYSDFD